MTNNEELIAHMRREHDRLIPRNFPDQGYDWRTPMTAMLDRVPELLNALEAAAESRQEWGIRATTAESERDAALAVIAKALGSWGLQELCDGEMEPEDGWRVASYVIETLREATP